MPDRGLDLPDPDEWLDDFTSGLSDITDLTGPPGSFSRGPLLTPGLLGSGNAGAGTASAPKHVGGPEVLPSHAFPSPHAGHYRTADEAAKAAASDVPKNTDLEYGSYFPGRYVTETVDLGDGFGPQSISYVDGYDYAGLRSSGKPGAVTLGPAPPHLGGWFHDHPRDADSSLDQFNIRQSPDDDDAIRQLQKLTP